MSEEAKAETQIDTHDLYVFLGNFVRKNERHPHIERRWIAARAAELHMIAGKLKMGGADGMTPEHQQSIKDMRLREIAEAKGRLTADIRALDVEAEKLAKGDDEVAA